MTNLIINMMYFFEKHQSKFSKEEIVDLINKNDIIQHKSYSVLGAIFLYEWGNYW